MPVTTVDQDDEADHLPYAPADAPLHVRLNRRRNRRRARLAAMPPKSSFRSTAEWIAVIVGALAVAFLIRTFLFGAYVIPSGSMEPTLEFQPTKDRVLVNKLAYKFHDINRGDVIVFDNPDPNPPDGTEVLIKRVIGLPGETIAMDSITGQVTINGQILTEPYINPACATPGDPLVTDPAVTDPATPVVFAAVQDPVTAGVIPSWEKASANMTGAAIKNGAAAARSLR